MVFLFGYHCEARSLPSPCVPDYDVGIHDNLQFGALLSLGYAVINKFGHCSTFLENSTIVFFLSIGVLVGISDIFSGVTPTYVGTSDYQFNFVDIRSYAII